MSTTLTIHITKEVLEQSKNCGIKEFAKGKTCGIAVAICHIWPKAYVNTDQILFNGFGDTDLLPNLPLSAQDFIRHFDLSTPEDRIKMQPFSFDIEVPDEVINQINIDEVLKLANTVTRKQLV
jgi:hypothetical protein